MAESFDIDMVKDDLTEVRNYEILPPFGLKFYREGFEEHWIDIHKSADKYNHVDLNIFNKQFKDFRSELNTRQLYLTIKNEFIGTCTAWNDLDGKYRGYGRIHWLAVIPAYQNRGLGRILLSETIKILKQFGYQKACLGTDRRRKNALHLYETFGFKINNT